MLNKKSSILYLLGFALMIYFFSSIDLNISGDAIKDYRFIAISIFFFLATFLINSLRMIYYLESIEKRQYSIKSLLRIEFISKYIYYITPSKMYLPAKAYLISKKFQISKSKSMAVITFEYATDTIATILLAICGVAFLFKETSSITGTKLAAILTIIILSIMSFIFLPKRYTDHILKLSEKTKIKKIRAILIKFCNILNTTKETWKKLAMSRKMNNIIFTTLIQVLSTAYSVKLIFQATGYDIPLIWIIAVNASSIFIGGISQVPGGLGIREGAGILLYTALGIPREISTISVITTRIYTIIPLILGYIMSIGFTDTQKKSNKEQ